MEISISPQALARLPNEGALKLVYDTEGCGCAVDGVTRLWLVDGPAPDDREADCPSYPVLYANRQDVFYEEHLQIDYSPERRAFTVSGKSQIYNHDADLIDRRTNKST